MRFDHQGGHAGRDAGGHAGAAQLDVGIRIGVQQRVREQRRVRVRDGGERLPGGQDVRLDEAVVPRRPAGAEERDLVVGARRRRLGPQRPDGDDRRRVARRGNPRVADCTRDRIQAVVAGRGHHHDARRDGALDRLDQWVGSRRLVNRVAERQVDDVDAERGAIRHREIDRRDDIAGVAGALVVEHSEADQPRTPRHADVLAARERPVARDQARDVGAVSVTVHGSRGGSRPGRKVVERADASVEIRGGVNAGVDDCDANAVGGVPSPDPERAPQPLPVILGRVRGVRRRPRVQRRRGVDRGRLRIQSRDRVLVSGPHDRVERDAHHVRVPSHVLERR